MESTLDQSFDYSSRAKKMKTIKQSKKQEDDKIAREELKKGLNAEQYWQRMVKSREDIFTFYQLYHPEYPEELSRAISIRLEKIVDKAKAGLELTEEERKYFVKKETNQWDPFKDIEDQKLQAKILLTQKRLEELMNE